MWNIILFIKELGCKFICVCPAGSPEALLYAAAQAKAAAMMADYQAGKIGFGPARMTENLNTPQADEFLLHANIVNPFLLTLKGYPAGAFQEKMHWWMMRNITICQNTLERARARGFKKVAIVVGAGHRMALEMLFSQMPGVKVWNINQYP